MDMPQPRRPPIFGPPRVNRFQTKCKYCKKEQNPDQLQWHETQCDKKPQDQLEQVINVGAKFLRGLSQGVQRNVQLIGNALTNELNNFSRNVFGNVQRPQQTQLTYQQQFDRHYEEAISARQQLPQTQPNLIEYDFQNQRNLSPSAKLCCICQDEYSVNERVVILQQTNLSNMQNEYLSIKLTMKLLLILLCLTSICFAQENESVKTNADDVLADIKELEKQEEIQASNQTQEVAQEEKKQDKKEETEKSIDSEELAELIEDNQENLFELLQALKPLFGLRFGDVERNDEGQVVEEAEVIQEDDVQERPAILEDEVEDVIKQIQADPLMLQWDEVMNDFDPEDLLTFDLASGTTEILSEIIQKPTTIRGAYFIPQFRMDQKIDFYIKTSNNTVLYSKERVQEGIFKIDIPEKGEYKFIFANKRTKETLPITFALDVHDSHQEFLKMADLDPLALRIERLQIAMRDNYFYDKMAGQQFEGGLKEVQNANNKLLIFSFIEIIGIVAITGWQVFYLKRIMSNQRII